MAQYVYVAVAQCTDRNKPFCLPVVQNFSFSLAFFEESKMKMTKKKSNKFSLKSADVTKQLAALRESNGVRARGKPVPLIVRELGGVRLLTSRVSYRQLAADLGVSLGTVSKWAQRLALHFFGQRERLSSLLQKTQQNQNQNQNQNQKQQFKNRRNIVDVGKMMAGEKVVVEQQQRPKDRTREFGNMTKPKRPITREEIREALRDKQRKGGAHRRKVRSRERRIVREALRQDSTLKLGELCDFLFKKAGVRVAKSTMCTLVNCELRLTRKRLARGLPKQAMTARNLALRRSFVERYFGATASKRKVGTRDERMDQQHWRVRLDSACRGASQCDRDGCRHFARCKTNIFY